MHLHQERLPISCRKCGAVADPIVVHPLVVAGRDGPAARVHVSSGKI